MITHSQSLKARGGRSIYDTSRPTLRKLRIYSTDPSMAQALATVGIFETICEIPWEDYPDDLLDPTISPTDSKMMIRQVEVSVDEHGHRNERNKYDGPAPGPIGEYIEVIDYDPSVNSFYKPVDLNDPYLLASDGHAPSEGNPQFHQQMVYAVAMRTVGIFERALGRRVFWAPHVTENGERQFVRRLRIYPHALNEPNAYYSRKNVALLFGYFRSRDVAEIDNDDDSVIFTCLSHDIIAHETTHALLDGICPRLLNATNVDVLAFHEAFSDVVALLQHFSMKGVLTHQIASSRGDFDDSSTDLGNLARQFGQALGRDRALRSAAGQPADPSRLKHALEPHDRGSILVAAVFDAFYAIYKRRAADLHRIARWGHADSGEISPDLVARLSKEAAKSAEHVLHMCIRALDFMPPVDVTFGDYLRAIITADMEAVPNDQHKYRTAFMEAFRNHGIYPAGLQSFSEDGLKWESADLTSGELYDGELLDRHAMRLLLGREFAEVLASWDLRKDREHVFQVLEERKDRVKGVIERSVQYKSPLIAGIDLNRPFEVESIRPCRRMTDEGDISIDATINITQSVPGYFDRTHSEAIAAWLFGPADPREPDFSFECGCTLIVDLETGLLKYCISKSYDDPERYVQHQRFFGSEFQKADLRAVYRGSEDGSAEVFRHLHMT